jgi:LacI family transcriptional regulator
MAQIAARAGVSKNTVSLALREDPQIPPATRRRIQRLARSMGYELNPVVAQLMVELRKGQVEGYRRTLALLNANQDEHAFQRHPTVPAYVEGIRRRATLLGYRLDTFWLHDPALNGERLERILRARGIRGVLVVGLMKENRLPARFAPLWDAFPTVVTGVRTREPTLPFCCSDHHALVIQAMEQTLALGYRRPALVVDEHIDRLVEGRFSAGMHIAQRALPVRQRVAGFYEVEAARREPRVFRTWLEKHRPDAILTLYNAVHTWVEEAGLRVPADLGLIQLERRIGNLDWAGMDQHNDQTGEAAVDMVVGMLHHHAPGQPPARRATLIGASWTPGTTVRAPEGAAARPEE